MTSKEQEREGGAADVCRERKIAPRAAAQRSGGVRLRGGWAEFVFSSVRMSVDGQEMSSLKSLGRVTERPLRYRSDRSVRRPPSRHATAIATAQRAGPRRSRQRKAKGRRSRGRAHSMCERKAYLSSATYLPARLSGLTRQSSEPLPTAANALTEPRHKPKAAIALQSDSARTVRFISGPVRALSRAAAVARAVASASGPNVPTSILKTRRLRMRPSGQ